LRSQAIEVQLLSVESGVESNQSLSSEIRDTLKQRLEGIEQQLAMISASQNRGIEELHRSVACYISSAQSMSDITTPPSGNLKQEERRIGLQKSRTWNSATNTIVNDIEYAESELLVGTKTPRYYHMTLRQKASGCDDTCLCACHFNHKIRNSRFESSALFNEIFGKLFLGYSAIPVPETHCHMKSCLNSGRRYALDVRYCFPTWALKRVLLATICSHSTTSPNFAFRIVRRLPYSPGNVFSRINSRDFDGAIELLQTGMALVNDTEAGHGISILGAALRNPVFVPGLVRFIEFLFARQVDPHMPNDEGESAWHFAARLMFPKTPRAIVPVELQQLLYRLFPNPDWETFQFTHVHKVVVGFRPLNLAEELQNPRYLSQINTKDALGQTPLGLAAMLGDDQAVETLLLAGADPNPYGDSRTTFHPLRKAVRAHNPRCVELLIMASAAPLATDIRGASILHTAAAGSDEVTVVRSLVLAGIPLDGQNVRKCTPLSFTPLKDSFKVASFLLSQGANINNIDLDGDTPLTESIRLNAHGCLRLFLEKGADYTTVNQRRRTVLHCAAVHADVQTINILSNGGLCGLNAKALDTSGKSPMACLLERQYLPANVMEAFENLVRSVSTDRSFEKDQDSKRTSVLFPSFMATGAQLMITNTPEASNYNHSLPFVWLKLRVCLWILVVVSISFTLLNSGRGCLGETSRPKEENASHIGLNASKVLCWWAVSMKL
jgi:ankyrin repeat protein